MDHSQEKKSKMGFGSPVCIAGVCVIKMWSEQALHLEWNE